MNNGLGRDTVCGFAAVNNGNHCVIGDHCAVCRQPAPSALVQGQEITLKDFGGLDGTYRIAGLFKGTLKLELVK